MGISRSDLLDELRHVTKIVDHSPKEEDMIEHGSYAYSTYFRYFESWTKAKELAGVPTSGPRQITEQALIDELERVNELVTGPPTRRDMDKIGDFPSSTYKYRFESWNAALDAADLTVNQVSPGEGEQRYGPDWLKYRGRALKRDRGQCRVCGVKFPDCGQGLHVHHITPLREFEDESGLIDYENSHALDNLVTLCPPCHWKFENRFTECGVKTFVRKAEQTIIRKEPSEDRRQHLEPAVGNSSPPRRPHGRVIRPGDRESTVSRPPREVFRRRQLGQGSRRRRRDTTTAWRRAGRGPRS